MKSENINNIVIVGGGTSGWMAAATLIKFFPQKHITLIESPDIPTIGVGESTTQFIRTWVKMLDIDDKEFMKECDATYKLSIKFNDFNYLGDGGFHYPFSSPYLEGCTWGLWDWHLVKYKNSNIKLSDFVDSYFPTASLYDVNKITENKDNSFDNFNFNLDVAYHFDATKFGRWLREKYAKPKGVKHIVETVEKVNTDKNGVTELVLSNGKTITADLFVDCSGFKSMLLEGALKVPFESFENTLINNMAWATPLEYKDKQLEMQPFTNCTALGNGWVWNTPLYSRIGTGYVFSTKHTTEEEALEEFKQYLMSDKIVVPRTKEEIETLPFRKVFMKTGIHSKVWEKNVVGIGLSSGFIEPLESNGLFSVHEYLLKLVRVLSVKRVNQFDKDMFNSAAIRLTKNFSEFVGLHYALTNRSDTDYWKEISNKEFSKDMINSKGNFAVGYQNFESMFMFKQEYNQPFDGINYISTGMGYLLLDDSIIKNKQVYYPKQDYDLLSEKFKIDFNIKKDRWKKAAEKELTMYEYLKKNIYKD
jgi:tryptophan halogenase